MVHALGAALVNDALGVAEDHILRRKPHRLDEFDTGDACCAGAVADELGRLHIASGDFQRVDQAGCRNDRRAVLVVMEDRDVHQFAQPLLDDEAFGRLDVLQIDPAEGGSEEAYAVDEFVGVLGIDLQIDRVHIGKALEEHGFAFHHRFRCQSTEIAEPKDCGAVGDHRHHVAARRIVESAAWIFRDCIDRHGHAWRIGKRKIALSRHRLGGVDLQLAGPAHGVEFERFLCADGGSCTYRFSCLTP